MSATESLDNRAARRLSEQRYKAAHRDEINARRRANRVTNGEKQKQHERNYVAKHKEEILQRDRLREPRRHPAKPVVYRFYGDEGVLLYVGMTIYWVKRRYRHQRYTPWFNEVKHVEVDYYPDEDIAADVEVGLIRSLRPRYNLTLVRRVTKRPRTPKQQEVEQP